MTSFLHVALAKGVRDAVLGALASAFNNYLDLGAGVLILWYAVFKRKRLSFGSFS